MAPRIHAVIMAGGSGTRFWPRSRRALPKQFLALGGSRSLLRETYERVAPICGPERVAVLTAAEHVARTRTELPELPPDSVLGEPVGRDTGACVGLAAEWLVARGAGDAVMLVVPSDHRIAPAERFQEGVRHAAAIAVEEKRLVTFGISPRGPSTAFGYIQRGAPSPGAGPVPAFRARRFVEKPDRSRAEEYLRSGDYYWNAGIFIWTVSAIRQAIARFFPELWADLEPLGKKLQAGSEIQPVLAGGFHRLEKKSIDRGVMEKAAAEGEVVVVVAPFEWDDLGSWNVLERCLPADGEGNHVEGRHVGLDTRDCIIAGSGRRLIATIGLRDLVVVETDDAILVCPRAEVERVKELVDRLDSRGEGDRT